MLGISYRTIYDIDFCKECTTAAVVQLQWQQLCITIRLQVLPQDLFLKTLAHPWYMVAYNNLFCRENQTSVFPTAAETPSGVSWWFRAMQVPPQSSIGRKIDIVRNIILRTNPTTEIQNHHFSFLLTFESEQDFLFHIAGTTVDWNIYYMVWHIRV